MVGDDINAEFVRTQRNQRVRLPGLVHAARLHTPRAGAGQQSERDELHAGGFGSALVERDDIALGDGDEHFELRRRGGGRFCAGLRVRVGLGRGRGDLPVDLEINHRVREPERQVLADLQVDDGGQLAHVGDDGEQQGLEHDLRARDAEHDRAGLELELVESLCDGGAQHGGVGAVSVGGEVERRGGHAGHSGLAAARGGLHDAEGTAIEVKRGGLRGQLRALLAGEGEFLQRESGERVAVSHGEPPFRFGSLTGREQPPSRH